MRFDEGLDARQSQAGAVRVRSGGEERFEQPAADRLVHAAAIVADEQGYGGGVRGGFDGDPAGITNRRPGIEQEIDYGMAELMRVDGNGGPRGAIVQQEAHPRTQQLAKIAANETKPFIEQQAFARRWGLPEVAE